MAVFNAQDPDFNEGDEGIRKSDFYDAATVCFMCSETLASVIKVYWAGPAVDGHDIAFHPECAKDFAIRIASDALKAYHAERKRIDAALKVR